MVLKLSLNPATLAVATFKASSERLCKTAPVLRPGFLQLGGRFRVRCLLAGRSVLLEAVRRVQAIRAAGRSSKAPNHALQRPPARAQVARSVQPGAAELGLVRRVLRGRIHEKRVIAMPPYMRRPVLGSPLEFAGELRIPTGNCPCPSPELSSVPQVQPLRCLLV